MFIKIGEVIVNRESIVCVVQYDERIDVVLNAQDRHGGALTLHYEKSITEDFNKIKQDILDYLGF